MTENKKATRVLLVEDDKFMVRMYQVRLSAEGFQVETATNGDECLDKIHFSPVDIVLLDLTLPLMDGFQVLEKIKSDPKTAPLPVIVFSNRSSPEDVHRAEKLGAEDFLVKVSTKPEEVIRKIHSALDKEMPKTVGPNRYRLAIDWNLFDARQMAEDLGIVLEYSGGKCISDIHLEAMPEYSHDEPWIIGRFITRKKP